MEIFEGREELKVVERGKITIRFRIIEKKDGSVNSTITVFEKGIAIEHYLSRYTGNDTELSWNRAVYGQKTMWECLRLKKKEG
jgi:hypothetical protein